MDGTVINLPPPVARPLFLPDSLTAARAHVYPLVGVVGDLRLFKLRSKYWDALAAADAPAVKLACQHMINALGEAIGSRDPEAAAALIARNRAEVDAQAAGLGSQRWAV